MKATLTTYIDTTFPSLISHLEKVQNRQKSEQRNFQSYRQGRQIQRSRQQRYSRRRPFIYRMWQSFSCRFGTFGQFYAWRTLFYRNRSIRRVFPTFSFLTHFHSETNLKEKRTLDILEGQNVDKKGDISKKNLISQILKLDGKVQVSMPTTALDSFEGYIDVTNKLPAKKSPTKKQKRGTEYSDIRLSPKKPSENKLPITTKQLLFRVSINNSRNC